MLDEEMYKELRGVEQLGYVVSVARKSSGGVHGLAFVILSSEYDPIFLQTKILEFIDTFYNEKLNE